ncbi:MAG: hypothetical protein RQ758_00055 [Methanomicrobiaceae archaeon]|nr:hypothetical protein [Methanomicrobiaceae archaeon]
MEPQERTAIILLASILVAIACAHLLIESQGREAFARPYSPESSEGELVSIEGLVEERHTTASGGHLLLRVRGVRVFVPATALPDQIPSRGDAVLAIGTVQTFRGEREVVVERASDLSITDR